MSGSTMMMSPRNEGEKVPFNPRSVAAYMGLKAQSMSFPSCDVAIAQAIQALNMKPCDSEETKKELQVEYDLIQSYLKEEEEKKQEEDFRRRNRNQVQDPEVVFIFSEEKFKNFEFARDGYFISKFPACDTLLPEHHRAQITTLRKSVAFEGAYAYQANDASSLEDDLRKAHEVTPIFLPSTKSNRGTLNPQATMLYLWVSTFDRPKMPINPIAVRILAKHEIYGYGYQSYRLPYDVCVLIRAWTTHVSKIRLGMFAGAIILLNDPKSTTEDIFSLRTKVTHYYDELVSMILALQLHLSRVIDTTSTVPEAIPIADYISHLKDVDGTAKKIKHFMFRDRVLATDLLAEPKELVCHELQLSAITDCQGNEEVSKFVRSLSSNKTPDQKKDLGPVLGAAPIAPPITKQGKIEKHCNYCGVKTSAHSGVTCPWRNKKRRGDLKKMSYDARKAGP